MTKYKTRIKWKQIGPVPEEQKNKKQKIQT